MAESDEENGGIAARESKCMRNYDSYKGHKPEDRGLSEIPDGEMSESLPSEPPYIGNWFSSYVYESPMLDENDGLALSLTREDESMLEKVNTRESKQEANKSMELDTSNVSTWELEHEPVSSAKVIDFSDSPSLLSEPPDIRNWFSSYQYESPQLSEIDGLGYVPPGNNELIIEESDKEEETTLGVIRKTRSKQEAIFPDRLGTHGYKEKKSVSMANGSFEEKEKKTLTGPLIGSTKELKQEPPSRLKQESSFNCEPFLREAKEESIYKHTISPRKPKPPSNWQHDAFLRELKLECLQDTITAVSRLESPRKDTQWVSRYESGTRILEADDKENLHRESTHTGFVAVKKDKSKVEPGRGILVGRLERKESARMACEEDGETKKRRQVLGETTNLQCADAMEMSGKWRCPQRNKVNLGPPLKQLRLDTWVRRL